jgi:hypothetical protein
MKIKGWQRWASTKGLEGDIIRDGTFPLYDTPYRVDNLQTCWLVFASKQHLLLPQASGRPLAFQPSRNRVSSALQGTGGQLFESILMIRIHTQFGYSIFERKLPALQHFEDGFFCSPISGHVEIYQTSIVC